MVRLERGRDGRPTRRFSLVRWGFFDAAFEQKESPDARVAEKLAREMLAKDPSLKAELDAKIAADPKFANDPSARLAFFYERSPWYATQDVGIYPVLRLDAAALNDARKLQAVPPLPLAGRGESFPE